MIMAMISPFVYTRYLLSRDDVDDGEILLTDVTRMIHRRFRADVVHIQAIINTTMAELCFQTTSCHRHVYYHYEYGYCQQII